MPGGFALLLAVACSKADGDLIYAFAQACLRRGLVWLSTVGDGCELAHDLFDEAEVMLTVDEPGWNSDRTILTAWHPDESPSQVLDFILDEAQPADGAGGARGSRLLVIADSRSSEQLGVRLGVRDVHFNLV